MNIIDFCNVLYKFLELRVGVSFQIRGVQISDWELFFFFILLPLPLPLPLIIFALTISVFG